MGHAELLTLLRLNSRRNCAEQFSGAAPNASTCQLGNLAMSPMLLEAYNCSSCVCSQEQKAQDAKTFHLATCLLTKHMQCAGMQHSTAAVQLVVEQEKLNAGGWIKIQQYRIDRSATGQLNQTPHTY
jgi:hypothetical protein